MNHLKPRIFELLTATLSSPTLTPYTNGALPFRRISLPALRFAKVQPELAEVIVITLPALNRKPALDVLLGATPIINSKVRARKLQMHLLPHRRGKAGESSALCQPFGGPVEVDSTLQVALPQPQ